jgi:hypothetical protein
MYLCGIINAYLNTIYPMAMNNKLTELTPEKYRCQSLQCPAVFKSDTGYVVIGKTTNNEYGELQGRVGADETAIEISADLLEAALAARSKE